MASDSSSLQTPGHDDLPDPPHQRQAHQMNPKPLAKDDNSTVTAQHTQLSGMIHAAPESKTHPTIPNSPPEISIHPHVKEMIVAATEVSETYLLGMNTPLVTDRHAPSQIVKVSTSTQTMPYIQQGTFEHQSSTVSVNAGPEVCDTKMAFFFAPPVGTQHLRPVQVTNIPSQESETDQKSPHGLDAKCKHVKPSAPENEEPQCACMPSVKPNTPPITPQHVPTSDVVMPKVSETMVTGVHTAPACQYPTQQPASNEQQQMSGTQPTGSSAQLVRPQHVRPSVITNVTQKISEVPPTGKNMPRGGGQHLLPSPASKEPQQVSETQPVRPKAQPVKLHDVPASKVTKVTRSMTELPPTGTHKPPGAQQLPPAPVSK
ncbi:hypothetical protein MRX96_046532 [Rhipicephalus microplus]